MTQVLYFKERAYNGREFADNMQKVLDILDHACAEIISTSVLNVERQRNDDDIYETFITYNPNGDPFSVSLVTEDRGEMFCGACGCSSLFGGGACWKCGVTQKGYVNFVSGESKRF